MPDERIETASQQKELLILPDTSWLVAILNEKDSHHVAAVSSLGALSPYGPSFHVPVLVSIELMSRLIRGNSDTVKSCRRKIIELLGNKLKARGASKKYDFKEILVIYEKFSRRKIKTLTAIDFCVVTEGISLGAKILTCDLKMYLLTKKYYKDIYFMSDKVNAQNSDLARLIHDIQSKR